MEIGDGKILPNYGKLLEGRFQSVLKKYNLSILYTTYTEDTQGLLYGYNVQGEDNTVRLEIVAASFGCPKIRTENGTVPLSDDNLVLYLNNKLNLGIVLEKTRAFTFGCKVTPILTDKMNRTMKGMTAKDYALIGFNEHSYILTKWENRMGVELMFFGGDIYTDLKLVL